MATAGGGTSCPETTGPPPRVASGALGEAALAIGVSAPGDGAGAGGAAMGFNPAGGGFGPSTAACSLVASCLAASSGFAEVSCSTFEAFLRENFRATAT